MPSASGKTRSSILNRLSFRRPFARKARAASPVSVLDDEVFLLSPNDDKEQLDIAPTFSSSSSIEGGVSLMREFGVSSAGGESTDEIIADTTETYVYTPTETNEHDRVVAIESTASIEQTDVDITVSDTKEEREVLDGNQSITSSPNPMPLVEHIVNTSNESIQASDGIKTVEEVAVASMKQKTDSSFGAPLESQNQNKTPVLEVGARVWIIGGSYKANYGTVEKVMKVKVQVNIDGLGSRRPEIKNVIVVGGSVASDASEDMNAGIKPNESTLNTANAHVTTVSQNGMSATEEPTVFKQGQTVLIVGGSKTEHIGKQGTITKVTKKMVQILIAGETKPVSKSMKSIELVTVSASNDYGAKEENIETRHEDSEPLLGVSTNADEPMYSADLLASEDVSTITNEDIETEEANENIVHIIGGKYNNESGRLLDATDKTVKVFIETLGKSVRVKRTNTSLGASGVHAVTSPNLSPFNVGEDWRLPDSGVGGMKWGTRMIVKIRTQRQGAKRTDHNFLTHLFQDRLMVSEIAMNPEETKQPPDVKVLDERGFGYELVSSKIQSDGEVSGGRHCQPKCVRLVYAQVFGPQRTPYSLKEELERLGDFASLNTRKVVARLELLQSPAYQFSRSGKKDPGMFALNKSDFVQLEHERNDGCGFISDDLLTKLCSQGGSTFAKRALALQVRIVIPKKGIYKGVLMRKRIPPGAPQIQLMPSMRKVGPSRNADTDDRAFLWITQAGMHPSNNNVMMARKLDPTANDPPKSFIKSVKKVSDDVLRLWQTLGVPEDLCKTYAKNSFGKLPHLQHASVVGVADPTNSIPAGQVFVTGMKHISQESIFVTRFPCNHHTDGRMLSNVTVKPKSMTEGDWIWLNELPFGAIIFADAKERMQPLPVHIADGDLDGDLYFVCWDTKILDHLDTEPILDIAVDEEEAPATKEAPQPDEDWLEKAQQQMIDTSKEYDMSILTGKLYNLAKKAAIENTELITSDPDAALFASAYKEALKHGKHGGKISLPAHLCEKVPVRLQKYLTSTPPLLA